MEMKKRREEQVKERKLRGDKNLNCKGANAGLANAVEWMEPMYQKYRGKVGS